MLLRKLSGEPPKTRLPKGTIDTQMHTYLPGFPALPGGPGNPPGILPTPAQYRTVMDWLGIDRVVITQANAHQRDNANLLACLAEMGRVARGVAVIDADTTDKDMRKLTDAGCVGARVMDLPGGAVGLAQLEAVDARAAQFNWTVAVQFDGNTIDVHQSRLQGMRSNWILDHHGKFFSSIAPDGPETDILKRLIDTGKCWYKFAGCYESSQSGGPEFEDVAAIASEIASYAPERIIWGTNWPHNLAQATEQYPDDALLLDTVLSWFPSEEARDLALVTNPETLFQFT